MIQRYDANGFPLPDVPDYGAFNQNFGSESNYALRGPKSTVSDLEAKAIANNTSTSTDRTPASGKYVYDSATGQYIWVPAGTAAPVGIAASPAYVNQDRGGRGDINPAEQGRINAFMDKETATDKALQTQENAEIGDRYAPVPNNFTQGARIQKDLSFLNPMNNPIMRGLQALFGTQNPNLVTVEDRTPVNVNNSITATAAQQAADDAEANAISNANTSTVGMKGLPSGYNASTSYGGVNAPTAGTGGVGKPGETAVGGAVAPTATNEGLTSRGITSGVTTADTTTTDVDSAVDAAPPSDSETGKDTGADGVGGGPGGCFLTTAAVSHMKQKDNGEVLNTLRDFRDTYMRKNKEKSKDVAWYYKNAPRIVAALDKRPDADKVYKKMYSDFIKPAYKAIQEGDDAHAYEIYKDGIDFAKKHSGIDKEDLTPRYGPRGMASGGISNFAGGGLGDLGGYSDGGRLLRGPGDGVSDSIPASIGGKRPARLADGEFVVPARIVSELGNGSTDAGARKLYAMLDRIQAGRKKTVGKGKVATNSRSDKNLPA